MLWTYLSIIYFQYGMDISTSLLEDLITTLDVDQNGEVSYKELVKGLELYQKEKRDVKKKGNTMTQGVQLFDFDFVVYRRDS